MPTTASDAKQIFLQAVEEHAPDKWPQFLDQACQGDPGLRDRVLALLKAHRQPNQVLDETGIVVPVPQPPIPETIGTVVGPYKLVEQLGEGGMGIVFAAEQREPVRRGVAVKIIKPGMDTREVIARFEAERQALALMDHPNIARVIDAGTTESGRPYFVMELINGSPINEYCDENNVHFRGRLNLFVSVCRAVQHAHQKGVIHRDIKPSNVLVTLHDDQPIVKVIDFGVAKAINQRLTEKTLFTQLSQMVGTPLYTSPEQAELSGHDIDTRSDIYSLGVLLYELLTGTTPFDRERIQHAAFDEVRRMIREDEPPKPSDRLSTLSKTRLDAASNQTMAPKKLAAIMQGELDWIVMKALEKDRTRRYESASEFAADVNRYLNGEAVEAHAPSTLYRIRKFVARNKAAVATIALLAVALMLGAAGTTWQALRAARAERENAVAMLNLAVRASADAGRLDDAEELFEQLDYRGYADDPGTLRTAITLAAALQEKDRLEDATELLQKTREVQQRVLGADHADTRNTVRSLQKLAENCLARAWQLSMPSDAPQNHYDRGARLSRIARQSDPSVPYALASLASVEQYRFGKWTESLSTIEASLQSEESEVMQWLVLTMAHQQLGHNAAARQWFKASCEWIVNQDINTIMQAEAASLLGLSAGDTMRELEDEDFVAFYTDMIRQYPEIGSLYHRRGTHHGRRQNWAAAAADYARAAETNPGDWRHWEAWLAVCLQLQDEMAYHGVWRRAFARFRDHRHTGNRMDVIQMRAFHPSEDVDWVLFDRLARAIEKRPVDDDYFQCAYATLAFRCGRMGEAIATFPKVPCFPRSVKLYAQSTFYRAIALWETGELERARELLVHGRREIQRVAATPDQPGVSPQDWPVVWCFAQAPLREAESRIEQVER